MKITWFTVSVPITFCTLILTGSARCCKSSSEYSCQLVCQAMFTKDTMTRQEQRHMLRGQCHGSSKSIMQCLQHKVKTPRDTNPIDSELSPLLGQLKWFTRSSLFYALTFRWAGYLDTFLYNIVRTHVNFFACGQKLHGLCPIDMIVCLQYYQDGKVLLGLPLFMSVVCLLSVCIVS